MCMYSKYNVQQANKACMACKSIACTNMYSMYIMYTQKYRQTLYLAVCSENGVGEILNWRISLLYGEKPMLVVQMD